MSGYVCKRVCAVCDKKIMGINVSFGLVETFAWSISRTVKTISTGVWVTLDGNVTRTFW